MKIKQQLSSSLLLINIFRLAGKLLKAICSGMIVCIMHEYTSQIVYTLLMFN